MNFKKIEREIEREKSKNNDNNNNNNWKDIKGNKRIATIIYNKIRTQAMYLCCNLFLNERDRRMMREVDQGHWDRACGGNGERENENWVEIIIHEEHANIVWTILSSFLPLDKHKTLLASNEYLYVLWQYIFRGISFSPSVYSWIEEEKERDGEKKLKREMKTAMNKVLCVCVCGWGYALVATLPKGLDKTTEAKWNWYVK